MPARWQRIRIEIPKEYGPDERRAIGLEILDHIRERTRSGVDKNGRTFKRYSPGYKESIDFRNAGKSAGRVDLTLSGDMLASMDLLSHRAGSLLIGFENHTEENARADGNIRGTYGQPQSTGKSRDFLGIRDRELNRILDGYPIDDEEARRLRTIRLLGAQRTAEQIQRDEEEEDA